MSICRRLILRQRFPNQLGTSSGFNLTWHKERQVHTLFRIWWPLLWHLHPKNKMHLLGLLNTLHFYATALAACLAAAKTLIMGKALKMIIHMHTVIPYQTSRHLKCLFGACQVFFFSFSWTSSLSSCLWLNDGIIPELLPNWDSLAKAL